MARFLTGLSKQTQAPATALRVNTSLQGVPIPLLLGGANRLAGNLIDYFGFNSQNAPQSGGGGKGGTFSGGSGKGQSGQYDYFASLIVGLCEGPVSGVSAIYVAGNINPNGYAASEAFAGDYTQVPWGYVESVLPAHGLNYRGLAYVGFPNYALGSSTSLPNFTFEVLSNNLFFLPGPQPDGDPTVALTQFLTNQYFGLGFPSARIGSFSAWRSYCLALGFAVSPVIASAIQAAAFASDLLTATNANACWQDGLLTVVPYGDQTVTAGQINNITEPHTVPTVASGLFSTITVGNVGTFVADLGVKYASGTPLIAVNTLPGAGEYWMSPAGVYYFNAGDNGASINITYSWAASASYVPDTAPIYDFTINDFLANQGTIGQGLAVGNSPLIVVRKPRDQMLNVLKLEYLDRNNNYNPVDIERKDSASIVAFKRVRPSDIKQHHFFCLASAAVQSAMLQLIRQQIPRTFQWTCGGHFVLILQLMKIATVSDPLQNLFRQPVRITEIQENQDGTLTVSAEEFLGTATSPVYGTQATQGFVLNYNADPGAINPPVVFEPTDELAAVMVPGGGLTIAGAVSGANTALWGGCEVWASYELNGTYSEVGTIFGPARMGKLTAALPSVTTNPVGQTIDQVNTLAVDLTESAGTLASGTTTDATALNTRCYVGPALGPGQGEIVAYETATLTAASKYNLSYLVRGAYGTEAEIATWPIGTSFARLDSGVFAFPYDRSRIGSTVYLKFRSFNIYRGGLQDLANVPAYAYAVQGFALASPLPNVQNLTSGFVGNIMELSWDEISDFRNVRYQVSVGNTYQGSQVLGIVAHPPFATRGDGLYWITGISQPAPGLTVFSEAPSSISVQGSTLIANLAASFEEDPTWPGIFGGGAINHAGVAQGGSSGNFLAVTNFLAQTDFLGYLTPGAASGGTYQIPNAHVVGLTAPVACKVQINWTTQGLSIYANFLAVTNFLGQTDFLGYAYAAAVDVIPQIRMAQAMGGGFLSTTNFLTEPDFLHINAWVWGAWQNYVTAYYTGMAFDAQIILNTIDPTVAPQCGKFQFLVDVPTRTDAYNLTIPPAGLSLTFQPQGAASPAAFNGGPGSSPVPVWGGGIVNPVNPLDQIEVSNVTLAGCTIKITNGGSPVAYSENVHLSFIGF